MNSDDKLIIKIGKGNEAAFNELFHKYGDIILGYCCKYLKSEQAEEVSQEVWMRVIKAAPEYQPQGKALNWIFTIARNLCFNQEVFYTIPIEEVQIESPISLEDLLMKESEIEIILDKVQSLSTNQKVCILMFYVEEKTIEEISKFLKISLGSVKVNLFRARSSLKQELL